MKAQVRVPATSANLGPGFDCLGIALDIYNTVEMSLGAEGLTIIATGEGSQEIPVDETNLVYQGAMCVFEQAHQCPPGLTIRLHNEIPLSRGLGSSAAAIVGGMTAANLLLGKPLSVDELLDLAMAMEGHPDNVAPALLGGFVLTKQVESRVHYIRHHLDDLGVILAVPDFPLSTSRARQVLPKTIPMEDAISNIGSVALLTASLILGDYTLLPWATTDKIHQPYRGTLIPGFAEVCRAAKEEGALGAVLSGAGPTILAFAPNSNVERIGEAMKAAFAKHGVNAQVLYTNVSPQGAFASTSP